MRIRNIAASVLTGKSREIEARFVCPSCSSEHKDIREAVKCVFSHIKDSTASKEEVESVALRILKSYVAGPGYDDLKTVPLALTDSKTGATTEVTNPEEFHTYLTLSVKRFLSVPSLVWRAWQFSWTLALMAVSGYVCTSIGQNDGPFPFLPIAIIGLYWYLVSSNDRNGRFIYAPVSSKWASIAFVASIADYFIGRFFW